MKHSVKVMSLAAGLGMMAEMAPRASAQTPPAAPPVQQQMQGQQTPPVQPSAQQTQTQKQQKNYPKASGAAGGARPEKRGIVH